MEKAVVWNQETVRSGEVAYQLVKEVYNWFGISDDGIPYTKREADGINRNRS